MGVSFMTDHYFSLHGLVRETKLDLLGIYNSLGPSPSFLAGSEARFTITSFLLTSTELNIRNFLNFMAVVAIVETQTSPSFACRVSYNI